MSNPLIPLPADLPENWEFDSIIAPNGSDIGMPVQYGYNYLTKQLNDTQKALNGFSGDVGKDYQALLEALALRYSKEEVDALLSQHNLAEASHPYILSQLVNKMDKGNPTKYKLLLINGFKRGHTADYWKMDNGLVVVTFDVGMGSGTQIPGTAHEIATLPLGLRPVAYTPHASGASRGPNGYKSIYCFIPPNGNITVYMDTSNEEIAATLCFYAD